MPLKLDVLSIQQHVESISQNGFTIIPNQIDQSWCDKLNVAADLATIAVDRALSSGIRLSHTLPSPYVCVARRFYCWNQSVRDLLDHDTVHLLGSTVLGETRLWDMTLLEARPLPERANLDGFDWHRDLQGYDWHRDFDVSDTQNGHSYLWIFFCLTDTTEENGATWVVPGTHRDGISVRHCVNQLSSNRPPATLQLRAKAGDLVAIDPTMIHSVGENRSRGNRRLLNVGLCRVGHDPLMNHWGVVPPKRRTQFSRRAQALLQTKDWRLDIDWDVLPENWQRPIDWDLRRAALHLQRRARLAFKGLLGFV